MILVVLQLPPRQQEDLLHGRQIEEFLLVQPSVVCSTETQIERLLTGGAFSHPQQDLIQLPSVRK